MSLLNHAGMRLNNPDHADAITALVVSKVSIVPKVSKIAKDYEISLMTIPT